MSSLLSPPLCSVPPLIVELALLEKVLSVMRTVAPAPTLMPVLVLFESTDFATVATEPLPAAFTPTLLPTSSAWLTVATVLALSSDTPLPVTLWI